MPFLLLSISSLFSAFFYVLWFLSWPRVSLGSFFWFSSYSFFSLAFLITGFILFFYFYFVAGRDKTSNEDEASIDIESAKKALVGFFQNNLYYIGFILLYMAAYFLIGPFVWYDFSYLIFIISFLILILFFISEKFSLFRDLIKINIILFSLYYIILFIYSFISQSYSFWIIDFLNQIFILSFFILGIYNDKTLLAKNTSDNGLIWYGLSYSLLFFVFYLSKAGFSPLLWFIYIGSIASVLLKYFTINFAILSGNKPIIKYLSLFFWYIALLSALLYFSIYSFHILVFGCLLYLIYDNIIIHINYQNYVSLLLGLAAGCYLYFYFYSHNLIHYEIGGYVLLCWSFLLYFGFILGWYVYRFSYPRDYYFIYIPIYILSIVSSIYFLAVYKFELFNFWVILFLEAILTFLIYYKFNNLKTNDQNDLPEWL